jgi:hypothetical protein
MHSFSEKNYQKGYETGEGSYTWRPGASLPSRTGTGIGTYLDIIPVPFGEMWCPRSLMQLFYKTPGGAPPDSDKNGEIKAFN